MTWTDRLRRMPVLAGLAVLAVAPACGEGDISVERGRALYRENGCGSCHGAAGDGGGPIADTLEPRPADLRYPKAFKRGTDEVGIAQMLAVGLPAAGSAPGMDDRAAHHHNQGMPPYSHLTMAERRSLARFVLSLEQELSR